jgi:hypothetical protein
MFINTYAKSPCISLHRSLPPYAAISSYTASLASILTSDKLAAPISGVQDLRNQPVAAYVTTVDRRVGLVYILCG